MLLKWKECELLWECLFFNSKISKIDRYLRTVYREEYCQRDYTHCAIYMVAQALGREKVPTDLYPNMRDRAQKILTKEQSLLKIR